MEWIRIFSSAAEAKTRLAEKKTQLLIVKGERICLALFNDEIFAVQDACSHNGESLSGGQVNFVGEIVCPWHNYRFDLRSGKPADSTCAELKTYPIKSGSDGFFIAI
jgi:nitrite reductase/ring-hydroxylating ferredoxin subunit